MARKQKMKVYHGIPKSITDEHTILYDSFDGVTTSLKDNNFSFIDSPTGYGIKILDTQHMKRGIPLVNTGVETHTLECWFYSGTTSADIFNFEDKSTPDQLKNRSVTLYYTTARGIQLTYFAEGSESQPRTISVPKTINIGWTHVRLIIEGNLVSLYVNGKLHSETITKIRPFGSVWLGAYTGFGGSEYKIPLMSDLHISKINRGDYFPNLPQDFIDGKAVIKPRMGQQQIKGDPMQSQTTTVKIPAFTNETSKLYCRYDNNTKGYLKDNPEIFDVVNANEWNQGSIFKIRGLNGEVISANTTPTVKTKNGAIVLGAWSSLGTNVVTFTLADNAPSLKGQDLYVEYSLTMPYGNSDFPELPHTVERAWGENGVEMKPTNTLTIVDDFFGKVGGSLKECPHIMDRYFNYGLITLDKITDKSSYQSYYSTLATKNGSTVHTSTNTSTGRGQIVFDINLIEMVERKLGVPIPQVDKVSWLKSNVIQIRFNHYGYGVGSNGNKLYLAKYNTVTKDWNTPGVSTTSSNVTLLRQVINPTYYEIDEKGHIYLLAYTDTSDGNVTANVRTDYISIEIDLKLDSNYTLMYCENTRAREDKCNPVLIQRETKTVKRYLPSKECFATESLYVSQPQSAGNISGDTSRTKLLEDPYIYICSLGTGFVSPTKEFYRDCLSHVGDSYIKSILCNLDGSVLEVNLNNSLRFTRVPCTTSNGNNKYVLPSKYFEGEYLCIKPFLTMKNNELVITLSLRHMRNGSHLYHTEREYSITNRPLIK